MRDEQQAAHDRELARTEQQAIDEMVLLREAGGFARNVSGRRLTHEKITHIRMGQMILGVAVVLACLAGMTWWATNMILKNEDLQAYIKKMEANQEDTNATVEKSPRP